MTIREEKQELINLAIGEAASLHFGDSPSAIFESTKAKQIADNLIASLDTIEGPIVTALVEALEKIADPRKRDHREPDAATELGCVMHIANFTEI